MLEAALTFPNSHNFNLIDHHPRMLTLGMSQIILFIIIIQLIVLKFLILISLLIAPLIIDAQNVSIYPNQNFSLRGRPIDNFDLQESFNLQLASGFDTHLNSFLQFEKRLKPRFLHSYKRTESRVSILLMLRMTKERERKAFFSIFAGMDMFFFNIQDINSVESYPLKTGKASKYQAYVGASKLLKLNTQVTLAPEVTFVYGNNQMISTPSSTSWNCKEFENSGSWSVGNLTTFFVAFRLALSVSVDHHEKNKMAFKPILSFSRFGLHGALHFSYHLAYQSKKQNVFLR